MDGRQDRNGGRMEDNNKMQLKIGTGITMNEINQVACNFVGTRATAGLCQLAVLINEGMKPKHTIFEIGCGALVGSIPIIRYLYKNKYCGTDPNEWLRDATLEIKDLLKRGITGLEGVIWDFSKFKPKILIYDAHKNK